jgi:hypothetical protein
LAKLGKLGEILKQGRRKVFPSLGTHHRKLGSSTINTTFTRTFITGLLMEYEYLREYIRNSAI